MNFARAVVVLLAAILALPASAHAQGKVKATHGHWKLRCDTPPGAKAEKCALMQSVTAEDRPNVGLTVIVLRTSDGKKRILRVLAPLGILLPAGLGLRIDGKDVGRVAFRRCLPGGCVAEVVMEDKLLKGMRSGGTATFIIFDTPEAGIGIPVSLKGFTTGFDNLK